MLKRNVVFLFVLLNGIAPVITAQRAPERMASLAIDNTSAEEEAFKQDGNRKINLRTGGVAAWYNVNQSTTGLSPEQRARDFLRNHAEALKLTDAESADLSLLRVVETSYGGNVVRFQQTYSGIPVDGGIISVTLNADGIVTYLANDYRPDIDLPLLDIITTTSEARQRVADHLRSTAPLLVDESDLVIHYDKGASRLVHRVRRKDANGSGDWEALVDAVTGELFSVRDRAAYHEEDPIPNDSLRNARMGKVDQAVLASGTGMVFLPDPLSSANATYGNPGFSDNNDADSPQLTAERVSVTLQDITLNAGVYSLESPYAKIVDHENPQNGLFSQGSSTFDFTRSQLGFEAVNSFYHIDRYMRYLNDDLGLNIWPTQYSGGPQIDPHGLNGDDNSHYTSGDGRIAMGVGGMDDAEDADVLIHELGHGLHDWASCISQSNGLSEGIGDWAAASYSLALGNWSPNSTQYNWVFNWDGHNEYWNGRVTNYNDSNTWPSGTGGGCLHECGQYWASSMVDIYENIGREDTEKAHWEGVKMLGCTATHVDAANAVLQAAINMSYPQSKIQAIVDAFANTGYPVIDPFNVAPHFTSSPVTQVDDNQTYEYQIVSVDANGDPISLTAPIIPSWITFEVTGNGTGRLFGTPTWQLAGSYNVQLRAEDDSGEFEVQSFTLTVNATNEGPSLISPPFPKAEENVPYTFTVTATDPDPEDTLVLYVDENTPLPAWLVFVDNTDRTGTLSGTPPPGSAGAYTIRLRVTDGFITRGMVQVLTVMNTPDAPVFTSAAPTETPEDVVFAYQVTSSDADGDSIALSAPDLPSWLSFIDHGNGTGTLSGTPSQADVNEYTITILASDGSFTTNHVFTLTVLDVNDAPEITSTPLEMAHEDAYYEYLFLSTDEDGDPITVSVGTIPDWLQFVDNRDGTATLSGTPDQLAVGATDIILSAADAESESIQEFTLTVLNTNDSPVFVSVPPGAVQELTAYRYDLTVTDEDGDTMVLTATGIPSFLSFSDSGNGTGVLTGTPGSMDAGDYIVTVTASDGIGSTDQIVPVSVTDSNRAPAFTTDFPITTPEDSPVLIAVTTSDEDADLLGLSAVSVPDWMTFTESPNGSGTLSGTPLQDHVGTHPIVLAVTDGQITIENTWMLEVTNVNDAPVWASIPIAGGYRVGKNIEILLSANDEDGDVLSFTASNLPAGLSVEQTGNQSARLTGIPATAGQFTISFMVSDGEFTIPTSVSLAVAQNSPPRFLTDVPERAHTGRPFLFTIRTEDDDSDPRVLTGVLIPGWLAFTDHGDGTASLSTSQVPSNVQDAEVTINSSDGFDTVQNSWTIRVNHAPVFPDIPFDETIPDGRQYMRTVSASDPENDPLTYSLLSGPVGSAIDPATGNVTWTPDIGFAGLEEIVIEASDGVLTAEMTIRLSVESAGIQSISQARASELGTFVRISGIVTRRDGSLVFIQDAVAGVAVDVSQTVGITPDSGDAITVDGMVTLVDGRLTIDAGSLSHTSSGNPLPAAVTVDLVSFLAGPAGYESRLLRLEDIRWSTPGLAGSIFAPGLEYGIRPKGGTAGSTTLFVSANGSWASASIAEDAFDFEGIVSRNTTNFYLLPLLTTDLVFRSTTATEWNGIPLVTALHSAYPNPFNPETTLEYSLESAGPVQLAVFDVNGKMVDQLVNREMPAGTYQARWDASGRPSGVYFVRLQTDSGVHSRTLVLLK